MKEYLKYLFKELADDNIDSMSSSIAYAFMLSLFPFLIGVFAILQLLQQSANIIAISLNALHDIVPEQARIFILENFQNASYERTGSILIISLSASIGFGSYGFKAIFTHLSSIMRDQKPRSFIWMTVLSILCSAAAIVVIAASSILLMTSNNLIHSLSAQLGLSDIVPKLLNIIRYPIVFLSLIISASIVYRIGPKRKMPFRSILISSIAFSCGWVIATFLFGLYVGKFAAYNVVYGALAGVIIFLMWMYLSAFIFLSSAEIGRMHMEHHQKTVSNKAPTEETGKTDKGGKDIP